MQFQDCLIDALTTVLDREIPEEVCSDALHAQACLLAGMDSDHASVLVWAVQEPRQFH
jgi:hypothetical protein